jgi:hypothetical protein
MLPCAALGAVMLALSTQGAVAQDSHGPADIAPPALNLPSEGARAVQLRPLFDWTRVPGASTYWLELGLDSLFVNTAWSDSALADTSAMPAGMLLNDTLYYWRVRARDSLGWGTPSRVATFRTGAHPLASVEALEFPVTVVGESSLLRLHLLNPGDHPVGIDSAVSPSRRFAAVDSLPPVILPGESLEVAIRFTPDQFMVWSEPFEFFTAYGTVRLRVSGNSPPPLLGTSADRCRFGPLGISDTAKAVLWIHNRGYFNALAVRTLSTRTPFFRAEPRPPFRIAPGESLSVTIRFHVQRHAPGRFGLFQDTLLVESNGGTTRVPLLGDVPYPRPVFGVSQVQFADVRFSDSVAQRVRIYNRSPNTLRIDSLRTLTSAFRASVPASVVRPGDSVALTIRFAPWRLGAAQDTIVLVSNGQERYQRLAVRGNSPFPVIGTTVREIAFGEVLKGERGKVVLGIYNSSINPLTIESIATRGRTFALERWSVSDVVRRGDTLRLSVLFAPDSSGRYSDTLTIISNAPGGPRRIPLSGVGIAPDTVSLAGGETALFPNYPNPFRGSTTFRFSLAGRSYVRLAVYNSLGQEMALVMEGEADAGFHNVRWQTDIASGVYFYKLIAVPVGSPEQQSVASGRLMVLK